MKSAMKWLVLVVAVVAFAGCAGKRTPEPPPGEVIILVPQVDYSEK